MGRVQALYSILGAVGIVALGFYVLACRPSWSPDGGSIVFSYYDPTKSERGAGLFDTRTGTMRVLYQRSPAADYDDDAFTVQWQMDGEGVIVSSTDFEAVQVFRVPLESNRSFRRFVLPRGFMNWFPIPEVGGALFFMGEDSICRLDLGSGAVTFASYDLGDFDARGLWGWQGKILCVAIKDADEEEGKAGTLWIGELHPRTLELKRRRVVKDADLAARGLWVDQGFPVSPEVNGSRVAWAGVRNAPGGEIVIMLIGRSGIQSVLATGLKSDDYELGNLVWASDRRTLYAGVFGTDEEEFWVGEIGLSTGDVRLIPITTVREEPRPQIALSPDGAALATSTAHMDEIDSEERSLFLVNLADSARTVTRIGIPWLLWPPREAPEGTE